MKRTEIPPSVQNSRPRSTQSLSSTLCFSLLGIASPPPPPFSPQIAQKTLAKPRPPPLSRASHPPRPARVSGDRARINDLKAPAGAIALVKLALVDGAVQREDALKRRGRPPGHRLQPPRGDNDKVYPEGTHFILPWFKRPIIDHVASSRALPGGPCDHGVIAWCADRCFAWSLSARSLPRTSSSSAPLCLPAILLPLMLLNGDGFDHLRNRGNAFMQVARLDAYIVYLYITLLRGNLQTTV